MAVTKNATGTWALERVDAGLGRGTLGLGNVGTQGHWYPGKTGCGDSGKRGRGNGDEEK